MWALNHSGPSQSYAKFLQMSAISSGKPYVFYIIQHRNLSCQLVVKVKNSVLRKLLALYENSAVHDKTVVSVKDGYVNLALSMSQLKYQFSSSTQETKHIILAFSQ